MAGVWRIAPGFRAAAVAPAKVGDGGAEDRHENALFLYTNCVQKQGASDGDLITDYRRQFLLLRCARAA